MTKLGYLEQWSEDFDALYDVMNSTATAEAKRGALKEFKHRLEDECKRAENYAACSDYNDDVRGLSLMLNECLAKFPRVSAPKEWASCLYDARGSMHFFLDRERRK